MRKPDGRLGARGGGVRPDTVVERVFRQCEGSPSEVARRLGAEIGEEITRQRAEMWRQRGTFPRELFPALVRLFKVSYEELCLAETISKNEAGVVWRAMKRACEPNEPRPTLFAEKLNTVQSDATYTRKHVESWLLADQFPVEVAWWVHKLTKIPMRRLIEGRSRGQPRVR